MRIISVDSIQGTEVLAKDILSSNNSVLMAAGTVVKKEYIKRLKDLGIDFIYAEDDIGQGIDLTDSLEIQIKEQCLGAVRDVLIKYSYHNNTELEEIKDIADEIINDIVKEPEVIYNLSSIREKSEYTYSHSLNVCALSVIIALKLKLPRKKIREIAIGCLLHDVGLIYLTEDYSDKLEISLTPKQLKDFRRHVVLGYSAVENMKWLKPVTKDIILYHHERLDGSGYPFRLKGDRIKIGARIAAVCDEFDNRVYGNMVTRMKVHDAIDFIVSRAESKFDLETVKAFVASVAAYPTGALVLTNENEIGIVLRQNPKCPTRPVIRIIKKANGEKPEEWIEKDLTKELTLFITDTILD